MNKFKHHTGGFTLVELLIAVAIIGILSVIALPSYNRYMERGYLSQAHTELLSINNLIKAELVKNPGMSANDLKTEIDNQINHYAGEPKLKEKYTYSPQLKSNNLRQYYLLASPKSTSGYTLAIRMDNHGEAYRCQSAEAAAQIDSTNDCEPLSGKK